MIAQPSCTAVSQLVVDACVLVMRVGMLSTTLCGVTNNDLHWLSLLVVSRFDAFAFNWQDVVEIMNIDQVANLT